MQASHFFQVIAERKGQKTGCKEELVFNMGYINKTKLIKLGQPLLKSGCGNYLQQLVN